MKIVLQILGDALFERVTKEVAARDSAFPRRLSQTRLLHWHIEKLSPPMQIDYLARPANQTSVVLIEVRHASDIEMLWEIGRRGYPILLDRRGPPAENSPLILLFEQPPAELGVMDIPLLADDWVCGKDAMHELARRVISSLRRQQRLQHELGTGQLSLNLESRKLMYAGDVVQLSPAEVPLAELFMSHVGSVIPIDEIHLMFQLTGRSLSGSNIRVTIFQLRFKIELLTRHQFTLACAYGEGYALRPGKGSAEPPSRSLTAMQSSTLHYG